MSVEWLLGALYLVTFCFVRKSKGEHTLTNHARMDSSPLPMKLNSADRILHQQFSEYGLNAREWIRKCALLLPEIDRRLIWKKKNFSGIHEYAAKLAGMSRESVDDALRIMKKVEEIPALLPIVEEKGLNRIRPLLNIITPENQDFWVEKAKTMSRHTLAIYVQNFRSEFRTGPEF